MAHWDEERDSRLSGVCALEQTRRVTEDQMPLTEAESRYLRCLAEGMTFEEIAAKFGWTYRDAVSFGHEFFDYDFEERKRQIPLLGDAGFKHYRLLLMRASKTPSSEQLIKRFEETGDEAYFVAFTELVLKQLMVK